MSNSLKIELSPEAKNIVVNLQKLPDNVLQAIARGMDQANQLAIATIKRDHLTGKGPFPPEEHKLGRRSGRLRGSVNATPAEIAGNIVASAIGSNVSYAALHEFGGRVHVASRPSRAKKKTRDTKEYEFTMPERMPFRAGIEETMPVYGRKISQGIVAEWDKLKD